MPKAETYEFSLLHPLGRSVLQIEPVWIRLKTHEYTSSDQAHLEKLYVPFEEAAEKHLDGLIVTGALSRKSLLSRSPIGTKSNAYSNMPAITSPQRWAFAGAGLP